MKRLAGVSRAARRRLVVALASVLLAACSPSTADRAATGASRGPTEAAAAASPSSGDSTAPGVAAAGPGQARTFPPPPDVPDGPLDPDTVALIDRTFGDLPSLDSEAIDALGASGDPRVAWLLADLLRFVRPGTAAGAAAVESVEQVTGTCVTGGNPWNVVTDRLIAWDLPAPPGYVRWKREVFELVEPGWTPFFADEDADIDWRIVSWGGVLMDDRPLDEVDAPCPEGCIPALNDPAVTDAAGGDWYADDRLVFGVVVDGDARAYPKHIMEVHEMVNDTLGGRRIGMPYCTLCGSAQVYLTDDVADGVDLGGTDAYELRTSGLLSRSNKVMFEFHTRSAFDTFTGEAVSGPLREANVVLEQRSVVTSTWGAWKRAHPDTTIVAEDGGIGRTYPRDPLGGRDDDGPIFPVGDVDPRLPVQEQVVGAVSPDGTAVAFPVAAARDALDAGETVALAGVRVRADAGGLTARLNDGSPIASHQAFWFAWSQFHPDTELWTPTVVD